MTTETNKVEIKTSTVTGAGLGVFSTCALAPGEHVTLYMGKTMKYDTSTGEYSQRLPTQEILVGDANYYDHGHCAHMINDAHTIDPGDSEDTLHTSALTYVRESPLNANICMKFTTDHQLWAVAYKSIAAGEELFCSYGLNYWMSRLLQKAVNERRLEDAIVLENTLLRLLPLERAGQTTPPDGWPAISQRLPPHIVCGPDGELAVPVRNNERPTDDECRRALAWAMVDPTRPNPYDTLKAAMTTPI